MCESTVTLIFLGVLFTVVTFLEIAGAITH